MNGEPAGPEHPRENSPQHPAAPGDVIQAGSAPDTNNPYFPSSAEGMGSSPHEQPVGLPHPGFFLSLCVMVLALFTQLCVFAAVAMLVTMIFRAQGKTLEQVSAFINENQVLLFPVGTSAILFVSLGLAFIFYGRSTSRAIGWRSFSAKQALATVLLIVPLGLLASELTNVMAEIVSAIQPDRLKNLREASNEAFSNLSGAPILFVVISACILPGIGEEILCRGVMGRGLLARYGLWIGPLLTSFLFGIMHLEPVQSFGAFVLGLGLHYIFITTRSLTAAMFAHALNNTIAFAFLKFGDDFPIPGISQLPENGQVHTPIYLVAAAIFALACACLFLYQSRTQWLLADGREWSPGYVTAESPHPSAGATAVEGKTGTFTLIASLVTFVLLIAAMVLSAKFP